MVDERERQELFAKRWEAYRKHGKVKYAIFLALLYSGTVFFVSVGWDFFHAELPFSEIGTFISNELLIKTVVFFVLGIVFGLYHFKKSEKKYLAIKEL